MSGPGIQWNQFSPELQDRLRTNEGAYIAYKVALFAALLAMVALVLAIFAVVP